MSRADRHSRVAWGVLFFGSLKSDQPMLLSEGWHQTARMRPAAFDGELRRTLLFKTRKQARAWCVDEHAEALAHSPKWRFRPVRVRETVRPT